jgi:hypothetical protein
MVVLWLTSKANRRNKTNGKQKEKKKKISKANFGSLQCTTKKPIEPYRLTTPIEHAPNHQEESRN